MQVGNKTIEVASAAAPPNLNPVYQLRFAENRLQIASQLGGDINTEASVLAALQWLAQQQEVDGRWDAARHGAGRETQTLERHRSGTGSKADTGMTALALLCTRISRVNLLPRYAVVWSLSCDRKCHRAIWQESNR